MNISSLASALQSLPYWDAFQKNPDFEDFADSVQEVSTAFDSLYIRVHQYIGLITDGKPMMMMSKDLQNQPLIEHLQKLACIADILTQDIGKTTDEVSEYIAECGAKEDIFKISILPESQD